MHLFSTVIFSSFDVHRNPSLDLEPQLERSLSAWSKVTQSGRPRDRPASLSSLNFETYPIITSDTYVHSSIFKFSKTLSVFKASVVPGKGLGVMLTVPKASRGQAGAWW